MTSEPTFQRADPAGATDQPFRVCVVCSGNICRSPIGEQVLRAAFADAGLADRVLVSSAGTGSWHVGHGANDTAVAVLAAAGYPTDHTARQISAAELATIDLVLAADRGHVRELRRLTSDRAKIVLLRSFDPEVTDTTDDEIPDPYYGPRSDFEDVLAMTVAAAPHIVASVKDRLDR